LFPPIKKTSFWVAFFIGGSGDYKREPFSGFCGASNIKVLEAFLTFTEKLAKNQMASM
jgi:hypothetical protein